MTDCPQYIVGILKTNPIIKSYHWLQGSRTAFLKWINKFIKNNHISAGPIWSCSGWFHLRKSWLLCGGWLASWHAGTPRKLSGLYNRISMENPPPLPSTPLQTTVSGQPFISTKIKCTNLTSVFMFHIFYLLQLYLFQLQHVFCEKTI